MSAENVERKYKGKRPPPKPVEKGPDALAIASQVAGALRMVGGGAPEVGKQSGTSGGVEASQVKPTGSEGVQGFERHAKPTSAPETKEWAKEVTEALAHGALPPKLDAQALSVSHAAIEPVKADIGWLIGEDMPQSEPIAKVVADIAVAKDLQNDPAYLVAKGAQVRWSMSADMPLEAQAEYYHVMGALKARAEQLMQAMSDVPPYLQEVANRHLTPNDVPTSQREARVADAEKKHKIALREKLRLERQAKRAQGEHVPSDPQQEVNDALLEAAKDNPEAKKFLMENPVRSPYVISYVQRELAEGKSMIEIAEGLWNSRRDPEVSKQLTADVRKDILQVVRVADNPIPDGPRWVKDTGFLGSGAPTVLNIWDGTKTGGKIDEALERISNQLDTLPELATSADFLDKARKEIAGFGKVEIARVGMTNPITELTKAYELAMGERARSFRGQDINEPFSSIQMNPEVRKAIVLYPEYTYMQAYRKIYLTVDFFPEGGLTEAVEYELRQMGQYFSARAYETDVKDLMIKNPDLVEKITGIPVPRDAAGEVDVTKLETHEFYKNRVARLKEVNDRNTSAENLLKTYAAGKFGLEMSKFGGAAANLGDSGVWRVKMNNGGLTGLAYELYDHIGMDMGISDEHGRLIRVTGREVELLKARVREAFRDNREQLNKIYQDYWKAQVGENLQDLEAKLGLEHQVPELDDLAIEGIIREAELLHTATMRDVAMTDRGQSPGDARGQDGQSVKYAGTRGIEVALRGRSPLRWFAERWDLMEPTGQLHLRVLAHEYARAAGVEPRVKEMVRLAQQDAAYKQELAERALGISEPDPVKREAAVKAALSFHFTFDLKGHAYDRKGILGTVLPHSAPDSIANLTSDQLQEIIMYREGIKYGDTLVGGYDYEGASWVVKEKLKQFERIYGKDAWLVALSDQKRNLGNDMLGADNPHDVEHYGHILVHGKDGQPGVLHTMAEYMPHRHFQDLIEHQDYETRKQFEAWVNEGVFEDVFTEQRVRIDRTTGNPMKNSDGSLMREPRRTVVIEANRADKAFKNLKQVQYMTDQLLAYDAELPINYAEGHGPTAAQDVRLTEICNNLGVNKAKYLTAMAKISTYVKSEHQLEKLVQPEYFDTYRMTQDLDPREKYLDTPRAEREKYMKKHPGAIPDGGFADSDSAFSAAVEIKASTEIGGEKGKGMQSGLGRVINDGAGATENAMKVLPNLLGARSEKQFLENIGDFSNKILFVAGETTKARGVGIMAGSWAMCAQMDVGKDILVYGSVLGDAIATSPFQRVSGLKGEHGDPSLTLNEIHHFWTQAQVNGKVALAKEVNWLNSEIERDLHLIAKFGHFETGLPLRAYQSYLWLLVALGIIGATTADTAEDELSNEGGGGGKPHH